MRYGKDVNVRSSRRDAILDAALHAFAERGFHGATMRQIASAANVTLANVYNYYAAKSDLLVAILRGASDDQLAATRAAVESEDTSVADRFSAAVAAYVRFDIERQDECFVANSELRYLDSADRKRIIEARDRQQKLFEDLLREGIASGEFRTPYPEQVCLAILTMCAGVTIWYTPDGPLSAQEVARRYARYALAMLEARP